MILATLVSFPVFEVFTLYLTFPETAPSGIVISDGVEYSKLP